MKEILLYEESKKSSGKCPCCNDTCKFIIQFNNNRIIIECKSGKKIISTLENIPNIIQKAKYTIYYCSNCKKELYFDSDNFKCNNCNNLYCEKCSDNHFKNNNHIRNIFIYSNWNCSYHNLEKNYFCDKCKMNLCEQCKKSHIGHYIKSFSIHNKKERKLYKLKISEYDIKLQQIIDDIKEIGIYNSRYFIMKNYLNSLLFINENLLKDFNYGILDYYNYSNFYYLYNYIQKLLDFDRTRLINYIIEDKYNFEIDEINLNEEFTNEIINELSCKKEKEIENSLALINYNKIFYIKDNLFLCLYNNKWGIFEYKDNSFHLLNDLFLYYPLVEIVKVKKFDYSDKIYICKKGFSKIFKRYIYDYEVYEYDKIRKNFLMKNDYLKKKEELERKLEMPYWKFTDYIKDIIDNKNGKIVISFLPSHDEGKTIKKYKNIMILKWGYDILYNFDKNHFLARKYVYEFSSNDKTVIDIFDSNNHNIIKTITSDNTLNYYGKIKDNLIFIEYTSNKVFL